MKKPSKKAVIIIVAVILVVAIATASLILIFGGGDFRSAKWGMSPEKVKARESAELINDSPYKLTFKTDNLLGVEEETNMFYNFDGKNGLWQVNIGYNVTGFSDKLASKLINAFEEKYGEPADYEETLISYEHVWNLDRTQIRISQQQIYVLVSYTDMDYVIKE